MNSLSLMFVAAPVGIGVFAFASTWAREYNDNRLVSFFAYLAMWFFMGAYTYLIVEIVLQWQSTFFAK